VVTRHPKLHPNWGFKLQPLGIKDKNGNWLWILLEDFDVNLLVKFPGKVVSSRVQIRMTKDFEYDGSSAPKFLWRLMPPQTGLHMRGSLVHDWLYEKKKAWIDGVYMDIPKEWADWIFRHIMLLDGYPVWKSKGAYSAVATFGKGTWDT
jgi:hypothetical protein